MNLEDAKIEDLTTLALCFFKFDKQFDYINENNIAYSQEFDTVLTNFTEICARPNYKTWSDCLRRFCVKHARKTKKGIYKPDL